MKAKWKLRSVAALLCLAPLAGAVEAQERPAPEPEEMAAGPEETPGDLPGDLDAMDELDVLLAVEVAGGPGEGPGRAMGPGAGGMGPGGRRGPGMGRGPGVQELREKLNLTEDQKSKLADIHDRQARAAIPIQGDLRIAGLDLRKLMRADKPDQRAIDAQIDRIATLRATLQKSRVASLLEARSVLTPAQQKLMREQRGGRRGWGLLGGPGMGRGPGGHRMRIGR